MKLILSMLSCVLFIVSCDKLEYSKEQYEEGKVVYKKFIPAHNDVHYYEDSNGNTTFNVDYIPEKYIMKFSCQHDPHFTISSDVASGIYDQMNVNDNVIITYRQVDSIKEKDGVEIGRKFHKWDFITARKYNENTPKEQ